MARRKKAYYSHYLTLFFSSFSSPLRQLHRFRDTPTSIVLSRTLSWGSNSGESTTSPRAFSDLRAYEGERVQRKQVERAGMERGARYGAAPRVPQNEMVRERVVDIMGFLAI